MPRRRARGPARAPRRGAPAPDETGALTRGDTAPEAQATGLRLGAALLALLPVVVVLGPVALLVRGEWGPLIALDTRVTAAAEDLSVAVPAVPRAAGVLTDLGDPLLMTVLTGLLAAALLAAGRARLALTLLVARAGALVLSQGTKAVVDRVRPQFEEPVGSALGPSFPSGHALGSAAFYVAAALVLAAVVPAVLARVLLALAVLVPPVVAATRVLLGVHYLSDVLAGLVLGTAWAVLVTLVGRRGRLRA